MALAAFVGIGFGWLFREVAFRANHPDRAKAAFFADIRPSKRSEFHKRAVEAASHNLDRLVQSDTPEVCANARAAQLMVKASLDRHWSEFPTAVAAWQSHTAGETEPRRHLNVDFANLTRRVSSIVLSFGAPGGGNIDVVLDLKERERVFAIDTGVTLDEVMYVRVEALVAEAGTATHGEAREIHLDKGSSQPIRIPNPEQVPVFAAVVNDLGRRSNAVRIFSVPIDSNGAWKGRPLGTRYGEFEPATTKATPRAPH